MGLCVYFFIIFINKSNNDNENEKNRIETGDRRKISPTKVWVGVCVCAHAVFRYYYYYLSDGAPLVAFYI